MPCNNLMIVFRRCVSFDRFSMGNVPIITLFALMETIFLSLRVSSQQFIFLVVPKSGCADNTGKKCLKSTQMSQIVLFSYHLQVCEVHFYSSCFVTRLTDLAKTTNVTLEANRSKRRQTPYALSAVPQLHKLVVGFRYYAKRIHKGRGLAWLAPLCSRPRSMQWRWLETREQIINFCLSGQTCPSQQVFLSSGHNQAKIHFSSTFTYILQKSLV